MEHVTIADVAKATGGRILCGNPDQVLSALVLDSREISKDCLFIPVVGEKTDAHRFIPSVMQAGAAASLTSEHDEVPADFDPSRGLIAVENTVSALTKIGELCRSRCMIPAIGVTGSVGKTTTREMVACALSAGKKVFRTNKNYNSLIGLPITLSLMPNDVDLAVLELGMNVPGELTGLAKEAILSAAVITNIGVAHMEHYGSQEAICEEKLSVRQGMLEGAPLFLNGDDPFLRAKKEGTGFPVITYGTSPDCDYRAEKISMNDGCASFTMVHGKVRVPVELHVPGGHNVLNALAALAVADYYHVDLNAAAEALGTYTGYAGRLQQWNVKGVRIIDDTYNASPASMKGGIDVLCGMKAQGSRICVLGDMFELGPKAKDFHREVGVYAAEKDLDMLVCVGEMSKEILRGAEENDAEFELCHFASGQDAAEFLCDTVESGDVVYLKASNGMKLKEIAAALKESLEA